MSALTPEQRTALHVPSLCHRGADTLRDALGLLPSGLDAYGSYVDNFGGFPELLGMKSRLNIHALFYSYTIFGNRANFADCEPGAMNAGDLPRWIPERGIPLPGHRVPGVYTSAGNADAIFDVMGLGGLPHNELPDKFIYQSAHYGLGPHVCHPDVCGFRAAHTTQHTDHGPHGENFDEQLWLPGVISNSPPAPQPEDYRMITAAELNGVPHVFVESKDGSIWYTYQPQDPQTSGPDRSWLGGVAGQHIAGLRPFAPAPK